MLNTSDYIGCTLKYQPLQTKTTTIFSQAKFDTKYDFDCIKSERAFNDARLNGEIVVLPAKDELQLDIDNAEDYDVYLSNIERFHEHLFTVISAKEAPSRSGKGKHITIKLENEISPEQRILYQLLLGSDRVREMLSYVRFLNDDLNPTLFVEQAGPTEPPLLAAPPEQNLLSGDVA
jgi:hypothetical protein